MDLTYRIALFVHVLSAVLMGFYLLAPFLLPGAKAEEAVRRVVAKVVGRLNRVGQYVLVAAVLSGGYMLHGANYSVIWIILVIVLVLALFTFSGMLGKPLRELAVHAPEATPENRDEGQAASVERRARMFAWLAAATYFLLVVVMLFPDI
ncbi:MAG: hypothetical protein BLM47_01460 [Candidatus Reconcilbacillus cellulovorans]|uniref:DUF2269 family protein n=1 Tax=Candidatus Reconcilbacillus cellulovorans TaxID=1906605 RepID=A0A2A6E392_9BACL|nr:MAG: hypothetical protein BLM47_01460 [Candidatus Reconcilbacillus cellulovorans]